MRAQTGSESRRIIVHAGWPKTATTSLQHQLRNYPNLGARPYSRPHEVVDRTICDNLLYNDEWLPQEFERWLEQCWRDHSRPLWYSDELLIGMPVAHWAGRFVSQEERARRVTGAWPATVVLTTRDPTSLLRSTYRHAVNRQQAYSHDYGTFLRRVAADRTEEHGPFAVKNVVKAFSRVVGTENVHAFRMEDCVGDPKWFWGTVGELASTPELALLGEESLPRENQAHSSLIAFRTTTNKILNRLPAAVNGRGSASRWIKIRFRPRSRLEALIPTFVRPNEPRSIGKWADVENVLASEIRDDFNSLDCFKTPKRAESGQSLVYRHPADVHD